MCQENTNLLYNKLKVQKLDVLKADLSDRTVTFSKPYIIVGLICPELSAVNDDLFNRINLKPYELACRNFANADFQYNLSDVSPSGNRAIGNIAFLVNNSNSVGTTTPLIIAYLEFDNI